MKDTFTLWGVLDCDAEEFLAFERTRQIARWAVGISGPSKKVVKLECRIVQPQRKPKRGKYPNDNFGLPAEYKPHNPDNLTRKQVGEGFRLLAMEEIWDRPQCSMRIHIWVEFCWEEFHLWSGSDEGSTYRVPINTPLDINPELKTK